MPDSTSSSVYHLRNLPSYCGQKLKLTSEILSPVCRQYTLEPESPEYSLFYGLVSLVDLIIIVFAVGSKLPSLLQTEHHSQQQLPLHSPPPLPPVDVTAPNSSPLVPFFNTILTAHEQLVSLIRGNVLLTSLLLLLLVRILYRVVVARVPAERLTVIRGVGIQLGAQNLFGQWTTAELVDAATITSFVIHEAYLRHRVVFFLAVACQDRPNLVLPFANTLPQLAVLRVVLNGARGVLYKNESRPNTTVTTTTTTTITTAMKQGPGTASPATLFSSTGANTNASTGASSSLAGGLDSTATLISSSRAASSTEDRSGVNSQSRNVVLPGLFSLAEIESLERRNEADHVINNNNNNHQIHQQATNSSSTSSSTTAQKMRSNIGGVNTNSSATATATTAMTSRRTTSTLYHQNANGDVDDDGGEDASTSSN